MTGEQPHILVVDDDQRLRDLLRRFLTDQGFMTATAADAAEAWSAMAAMTFDLIVLDLMMPGESGLDLARRIRATRPLPILMLTAMGEAEQRIQGLESGADDYLVKPFEPRELVLRIKSVLRRAQPGIAAAPATDIVLGEVRFDRARLELSRAGERIHLTEVEAQLLAALAEQPGVVFDRDLLGDRTGAGGRAIDVQVTRLRRKIEPDPRQPRYLQTVRGRGYSLNPD
jgi:two-component system phosphate regulon response regulator OmpR